MRYREITEAPETWEARHRGFRRQQAKKVKLLGKQRDTEAKAYQQHRRNVDQQASTNTKLRSIRHDLANTTKPD